MTKKQNTQEDPSLRWDEFSIESWEFFFHQAEKMLETTIQASDSFQNRAVRFLSFYVPAMIAIAGLIVTKITIIAYVIPLFIILIGLLSSSLRYLRILKSRQSFRTGSLPRDLIGAEWLDYNKKQQQKLILRNECLQYEIRIKQRMQQNEDAGRLFNAGISDIITVLILACLIFLGITFFPFG